MLKNIPLALGALCMALALVIQCGSSECRLNAKRMNNGILINCAGDECASTFPEQKSDSSFACPMKKEKE